MANSRTPISYRRNMSRLKNDQSMERLQNSNSVSRIIPPTNLDQIEVPQSVLVYGNQELPKQEPRRNKALIGQGPQISIETRKAAIEMSPQRYDINLDNVMGGIGKRQSRNAIHTQVNTDVLKTNKLEMHISEEDNSTTPFVKD